MSRSTVRKEEADKEILDNLEALCNQGFNLQYLQEDGEVLRGRAFHADELRKCRFEIGNEWFCARLA